MHLFTSNVLQKQTNVLYPNEIEVCDIASLKKAVSNDYVCARYKENKRSNKNFIVTDCLALDCDNTHTEDKDKWVTIDLIKTLLPDVGFYVHYSRNHMKEKDGKSARPKFHIFFPINEIEAYEDYRSLKERIINLYPFFDFGAKDAARFFYGTKDPNVEIVKGELLITDFIDEGKFTEYCNKKIEVGGRNNYLSRLASKLLVRYGDTEKAHSNFVATNESYCNPPLEDSELNTIWNSAIKFYKNSVLTNPNYVAPEKYNLNRSYKPSKFTDTDQAYVLANTFGDILKYSPSTSFLVYADGYWEESDEKAQGIVHKLTSLQMQEAEEKIASLTRKLADNGTLLKIKGAGKKLDLLDVLSEEEYLDYKELQNSKEYYKFALKRRDSGFIQATLRQAKTTTLTAPGKLNFNPFLLNTPKGTYDLRKGIDGFKEHDACDLITRITAVSPSEKGKQIWGDCLNKIFKEKELIDYVQMICGLAAIGKIFVEAMIIAYGGGGNGKSTFWNAIFRVLGSYSGKISADTLTVGCKRNVKPEMAEMAGRRLLIASESEEGARLNDSIVKQLCSTDEIFAEKKYKDPFYFTPSHTLVLYTNHLPRVRGSDDGIWRRLIVVPFNNSLTGPNDIKNYADVLFEEAGEYILTWIIEGAKKVIDMKFKIPLPKVVEDAINEYREQNDWFHQFLDECCDVSPEFIESSNDLYQAYCHYCDEANEYKRNKADFYTALDINGFKRKNTKRKRMITGLKLIVGSEFDDFLQ